MPEDPPLGGAHHVLMVMIRGNPPCASGKDGEVAILKYAQSTCSSLEPISSGPTPLGSQQGLTSANPSAFAPT